MYKMQTYKCKRCGQESTTKGNLIQHLQRKNVCEPLLCDISREEHISELLAKKLNEKTYDCDRCGVKFNCYQSRWRHKKVCKKPDPHEEINKLKIEINELRRQIESNANVKNVSYNTHNRNTQNTINNNININVKNFGSENVSYLPKDFLTRCFTTKNIVRLIENIHCDKEHPENHNIRIKSKKKNTMETREDEKWIVKDEDEALTECIQNGYRILVKHAWKHKNEIIEDELDDDEDEYHNINEWLEAVYNNKKEQKPIKRKLMLLFVNNQALLLGKDDE